MGAVSAAGADAFLEELGAELLDAVGADGAFWAQEAVVAAIKKAGASRMARRLFTSMF